MEKFRNCINCWYPMPVPTMEECIEVTKAENPNATEKSIEALAKIRYDFPDYRGQICSNCGELVDVASISEGELIQRVYSHYKEFKKFMDGTPLPDEIIVELVGSNDIHGRCRFDEKQGKFVISVQKKLQSELCEIKPVVYHEFTHIADMYNPETGGQLDDIDTNKWVSEYRASQVQIMAMLGFERINERKAINLSSPVVHMVKTQSLLEYVKYTLATWLKTLKDWNRYGITKGGAAGIVNVIMYTKSLLDFCKQYQTNEELPTMSDIENYVKSLLPDDDFRSEFNRLIRLIDGDKISDPNLLKRTIEKIWLLLFTAISQSKQRATNIFPNIDTVNIDLMEQWLERATDEMNKSDTISGLTLLALKRTADEANVNYLNYLQPNGNGLALDIELWKQHFNKNNITA